MARQNQQPYMYGELQGNVYSQPQFAVELEGDTPEIPPYSPHTFSERNVGHDADRTSPINSPQAGRPYSQFADHSKQFLEPERKQDPIDTFSQTAADLRNELAALVMTRSRSSVNLVEQLFISQN